jgi:hypothetical protein
MKMNILQKLIGEKDILLHFHHPYLVNFNYSILEENTFIL